EPHGTAEGGYADRRIGHGDVPAGIATRIFVVGGEHGAAPLVEPLDIGRDRIAIFDLAAGARDDHVSPGRILLRPVFQYARSHSSSPLLPGLRAAWICKKPPQCPGGFVSRRFHMTV